MKGKRLLAFVLAMLLTFSAAWGNTSWMLETQAEEAQEQKLENIRRPEKGVTWMFLEEDTYTVSLNTEGMENITQVQWNIILYENEEPVNIDQIPNLPLEDIYSIDEENYSITLYQTGLSQITEYMREGNQWFDLGVEVNYGKNEVFEQWVSVALMPEEYFVHYLEGQGEDQMLPNEDKYLRRFLEISVWDREHLDGAAFECQIMDMEILAQYHWDENGEAYPADEEFFWLNGNSEEGWNLHSEDHGYAEIRAYYVNEKGEDATHDFKVYSIGEIYHLEILFENDTNDILTNYAEIIETRLTKKYQDHEGNNQYNVEVDDYFLQVNNGYSSDMIHTIASGKRIIVQTGDVEAMVGFEINAFTKDGAEPVQLVSRWVDVRISDEYYNIQPTALENPGLGKILDLSGLYVYCYNADYPNGKRMDSDDVRLSVEYYETSVLEPTEDLDVNPLPNFVRFGQDGANIGILAEGRFEEGWRELTRRDFWIDWLDYSVRFENLQNGDHGWIYVEDEKTFYLNTDNLTDKEDYEVVFDLGLHQEETQEFVPFENQDGLFEEVKENGKTIGITINGSKMKEMEELLAEGGWFWICVTVNADDQETFCEWRGIELRETELEYHYNEWGFGMLPHWDHGIGKNFGYYLRDAEHPEGYEGEIQYTDIQMEIVEGEEDVLFVDEWEDGTGWNLHANNYGHAVITLTHPDVQNPGEEIKHSFDVWVGQDVWDVWLKSSTGTNDICPGTSVDLTAEIAHHCYTEEDGHFEGDTEQVVYEWGYTEGVNQDLLEIEPEGNVLHITAKEDAEYDWSTCVYVRAYMADEDGNIMQDENGNDIEVGYNDYWLNIRDHYLILLPIEISETPEVGEEIQITPVLQYVSSTENKEFTENVVFNWEWDPELVEITDGEGNVLAPTEEHHRSPYGTGTYTIKKLGRDGSDLWLRAYIQEDGEYHEVFCRNFYIEHMDYNVDFTDMQNGDHGWVYVDDEVVFHINTDNLQDKENYDLKFEIGVDRDGTFVPMENQDGLFGVVTEDGTIVGIKIKGNDIKAIEDQLDEGSWFCIKVTVSVDGNELHSLWRGVELRENQIDYHYNEWGFSMLPHWDRGIGKNFGYYLCDFENPDGYEGELKYTDIQVEIIEGEEDAVVVDEWEDGTGWNLHANSYGHAVITLSHKDVVNPKETLQHSFDVWVGQDVWNIEFKTSTGTTDIVPGETMDLTAIVDHHCYNEEDGYFEGFTEPLYYEWGYLDGSNEEIFDYEADGNVVHISAREDAPYNESAGLYLRIYLLDENGNIMKDDQGNDMEVYYADTWFDIREGYFKILPIELEKTLELGETVKITPTLHLVNKEGEVEYTDVTMFEWAWDPETVEIKDGKGNILTPNEYGRSDFGTGIYTLKKLVSWDANVQLRAYIEEDGEYHEVAYRELYTRDIDYHVWFEKDRGDEWSMSLFENEEDYPVTLNTDNLRDEDGNLKENISIEWSVCKMDDENHILDTATKGVEYTISEDGTTIYLNGKLLKKNGFVDNNRIFVNVKSNGMNVQDHPHSLIFWLHEAYVELENDYEGDTLCAEIGGWYYGPEGINIYVENSVYPDGAGLLAEIRKIETTAIDGAEGEVFDISRETDGSWRIMPLRCGAAQLTYTLYHETLGEIVVTREKGVADEIYRVDLSSDANSFGMLPGSEFNLITEVIQFKAYEDGTWEAAIIPKERYEISYDYNQDLIHIDKNGKVTSFGEFGDTDIYVNAEVKMLNGTDIYYTGTNGYIYVTDRYMKVYDEDRTVNVKDTIRVSDLGIQVIETTLEHPEGIAYEPETIELIEMDWLKISANGESFTFDKEALGDAFPIDVQLHYKAVYDGWEYYDFVTLTIEKDEEVPKVSVTEVFPDVSAGSWYLDAVQYVYDHGLMSGSNGLFNPTGNVTRAQLVTTLYNISGRPKVDNYKACKELIDVKEGQWYTDAVCWAYNMGVASGNGATKMFNMSKSVTREQLATFFYNYAKHRGLDITTRGDYSALQGANEVASYAEDTMRWAYGTGLISGSKSTVNGVTVYNLNPKGTATRAQVATILRNFCENNNL